MGEALSDAAILPSVRLSVPVARWLHDVHVDQTAIAGVQAYRFADGS